MEVLYKDQKMAKLCNDSRKRQRKLGALRAKKVGLRLQQLDAADDLALFQGQPALGRCHELTGDRAGQLSLDLDGPYRLIIEPANDPLPTKDDGGLDWSRVTKVLIIEIANTHE